MRSLVPKALRGLAPVVLACLALLPVACRRQSAPPLASEPWPETIGAGGGIAASAAVCEDPETLRKIFRADLQGAGVVPVFVRVSNHDTIAVVLHSRGAIPLGEEFRGFALEAGTGPLEPLDPLAVATRLQDRTAAPNYPRVGGWQAVGGMAVPPLGVYYFYQWGRYALRYRPLLTHSFFPATRGGLLGPVTIEPGETAAGFLYFAPTPRRPTHYAEPGSEAERGAKSEPLWKADSGSGLELAVRPCLFPSGALLGAIESPYEISGVRLARSDKAPGGGDEEYIAAGRSGAPRGDLFLLGRPRPVSGDGIKSAAGRGRLELLFGDLDALLRSRSTTGFVALERLGGGAGEIADAARFGRYAVCAVNFKQKARLLLIDTSGTEPVLAARLRLERRVVRVFARSDGIYVVTDDGFCGVYGYADLGRLWYGRLGTSVGEAFLVDGLLLVFGGGEAAEFECSGGRCGGPKRRLPAPARSIRQGAAGITTAALIHRGAGAHGDTLVLYETASLREAARLPFPGRIETLAFAAADGFILQAEGGLLLRLGSGATGGGIDVRDAGWLPLGAGALVAAGREQVIALSREGTLFVFESETLRPAPLPALRGGVLKVPVGFGAEGCGGGGR